MTALGQIVTTSGVQDLLERSPLDLAPYLERHASADFGDLDGPDTDLNRNALRHGGRLVSIYNLEPGVKIYIITEADRDRTTILLPEEY